MHIDNYSFGYFVIDSKTYGQDIKIVNSEIKLWHNHHLCLGDVRDIVSAKPKPSVIIIGTGSAGVVEVSQEIREFITKAGIKLVIAKTAEACRIYNDLSKKENVAAILHSTC